MNKTVANSLNLVSLNLKNSWRENKIGYIGLVFYLLLVGGVFGAFFGYLYHIYLSGGYMGEYSPIHDFHYVQLVIFIFLYYYGLIQTLTGLLHPMVTTQDTGELMLRIPVDHKTLYLATLMSLLSKSVVIILMYFIMFVPMLVLGNFRWWVWFLFLLAIILAFLQLIFILQFVFFITRTIRDRIKNVEFLYNTSSVWVGVMMLAPLIISFEILVKEFVPRVNMVQDYAFVPLLNSSLAITGLFLRSGITSYAISGIVSQFLVISILGIVNVIFATRYNYYHELDTTLAKYKYVNQLHKQGFSMGTRTYPLLSQIDTGGFTAGEKLKTLIYKDWLALRRTVLGDKMVYSLPFVILILGYLFFNNLLSSYHFILSFVLIYVATNIVQIIINMETDELIDRGLISSWEIRLEKILVFSIIHLVVFSPLLIFNPLAIIPGSIIVGIILGFFYNQDILSSKFGYALISFLQMPILILSIGVLGM